MRWKPIQLRGPIGLDVGDRWIKAVQLDASRRRVEAVAMAPRDEGAPVAVAVAGAQGGEAAKPQAAVGTLTDNEVERLRDVLRRRGFTGNAVIVAVPSRATLTSVLELPPRGSGAPLEHIARNELAHVHRREAARMEVAIWDLPAALRATEGNQVMAAGCTHEDAEAILGPLEKHGLDPLALDTQGWALARVCAPLLDKPQEIVAAVDLGWSAATLVLLHQNTVVYERSLANAGLRGLHEALRKGCGFKPDVVEYVLRDGGFHEARRREDGHLLAKARGHLESHFEGLAQELRLSMSYAQHQYPRASVAQVVLAGGGAGVPKLAEHLVAQVDTQVRPLSPMDVAACPPGLAQDATPAVMLALGLALYDGRENACQAA